MEPSGLESSFVNWIWWSIELRWFRKLSTCDDFMMVSVSSTNLLQNDGGLGDDLWPWFLGPPYTSLEVYSKSCCKI